MSNNKGLLGRFFGGISTFLTKVRIVLVNLLTAIILISLLFSIGSLFSQRESFEMPESGALRVALDGNLVDQKTYSDPMEVLLNPDMPTETLVYELVQAIDMAAKDERINSMTLILDELESAGMSKIEEVGTAILRFRETGKPVIAVADNFSQQQYLLASYADRILMHPMGVVELLGYASYQTYMADALEKLKVDVNVFRTGPHKNAVEPFIANEMSNESKEQAQWLIDDLWEQYKQGLMARRGMTEEQIQGYTHSIDQTMLETGMSLGEIALSSNLVDALVTRDELMAEIQAVAGANEEGDFYNFTNAIAYLKNNTNPFEQGNEKPKVGYLVAKGQISDGVQPSGSIGGDSLAYQLKQARLNDELSALVLRVDSPGGSAFASEVIRRELELFKKQEIPIVVSMGSVAASGGYWISMPADEIWATPSTLTGSIGVFSVVPTIDRSMSSLGLTTDGVDTTPLSSAFRLDQPLTEQAKTIFQQQVNNLYRNFLSIVTNARDMPQEQLEPLAGGRVWTGTQALEIGLVDKIGNQFEAIESAAKLAGVEDNYRIHKVEPQLSFTEQLLKQFFEQVNISFSIKELGWLKHFSSLLDKTPEQANILLSDPQHMYLHCGDCLLGI